LPSATGKVKELASIQGSATDPFGVVAASISIQEAGGPYWNGSTFSASAETWFDASLSGSGQTKTFMWSGSGFPAFQDNYQYQVRAKAIDTARNEDFSAVTTFLFDTTKPDSRINSPLDGSFQQTNLAMLSGTATDPNANRSNVAGVELAVEKTPGSGNYWDGQGAFTSGEKWVPANSFTAAQNVTWQETGGLPTWEEGIVYSVRARAYDVAGSTQTAIASAISFTMDDTRPATYVVEPPAGGSAKEA